MDATTAAGLIGAGGAVLGALAAGGAAVAVEGRRSRAGRLEAHRHEIRSVCSQFTSAIARVRSNSYNLKRDAAAERAGLAALEEARVGCEQLRLLLDDKSTQRAARLALRHAYAVWMTAQHGVDPREAESKGKKPEKRLREELTKLYVGVRTELGVEHPADVFEELED